MKKAVNLIENKGQDIETYNSKRISKWPINIEAPNFVIHQRNHKKILWPIHYNGEN